MLVVVCACACPAGALNLVGNPGFERVAAANRAEGWEPLVFGVPATFAVDEQARRSGARSLRIDASEVTRSYICTSWVAVAGGERLRVRAWVKARYAHDRGTVIAIGEFQGTRSEGVVNLGVAGRQAEWQELGKAVEVPATATAMRLRLGFSYCKGTCWWDDVSLEPEQTLVARPELVDGRLYPGAGAAVQIINRSAERGPITAAVGLGQEDASARVDLDGQPVQRVVVPLKAEQRGERPLWLELRRAEKGKPVFASESKVTIPPPATLMPLIPTHWVIEDGPPRIDGEIELALGADGTRETRLVVREPEGREIASRTLADLRASGVSAFRVEFPEVREGPYRVTVEVGGAADRKVTVEQPWGVIRRDRARVTLNSAGFPQVDGQAIFPLGMFNNGGRLKECAAAGLNLSHTYNAAYVYPGQRPDDQRLKNLLDLSEEAGVHCLLLLPLRYASGGEWDGFRRRVRMFRNHPALLAWDEEELLARGNATLETLVKMRQIVREEDPHHPFMVGDSRGPVLGSEDRRRFFPDEQMDLGMWWWYPFPMAARRADELAGEDAASGAVLEPPTFLTQAATKKPLWVGVQCYKKPGADARYPTPAEYRAQAYAAICSGAKGLMWYGGSVTGGLFLAPQEGHWDELKALIREVRELEPFLLAPAGESVRHRPVEAPISTTLRRLGDQAVLIAVNRGPAAVDLTFTLPSSQSGSASVRGENRTVPISANQLRDHFAPLAVHVYEFRCSPSS